MSEWSIIIGYVDTIYDYSLDQERDIETYLILRERERARETCTYALLCDTVYILYIGLFAFISHTIFYGDVGSVLNLFVRAMRSVSLWNERGTPYAHWFP